MNDGFTLSHIKIDYIYWMIWIQFEVKQFNMDACEHHNALLSHNSSQFTKVLHWHWSLNSLNAFQSYLLSVGSLEAVDH